MKHLLLIAALFISALSFSQTVTATTDHSITLSDAATMTHAFRSVNSTANLGETFGKNAVQAILNQSGCVGIRIYYAMDTNSTLKVIIVGIDSANKDMYQGLLAERGACCTPLACFPCAALSNSNPLNTNQ